MPFMTNPNPCKVCGVCDKETRTKYHYINKKYYLQSTCKDCERSKFSKYQKENKTKFSDYNKKAYINKNGPLKRNMNHTVESRAEWHRQKSNARCSRAKQARFKDEFTKFVTKEAHDLRVRRNRLTGIEWHVDHIIPLKGKNVCGLHLWTNLAVIPKVENLRKGNKNSIHD
jgi:predicted  nucleic acid-binding Zn-ribbon protein